MSLTRSLSWLFLFFPLISASQAGFTAKSRDHQIEAEDYFSIGTISDVTLSPNGAFAVYAESRWEKEHNGRNRDLWILDMKTQKVDRLTFDAANDHHPVWSPDSLAIYFLSNRKKPAEEEPPWDGTTQVWRISARGGDPFPVTKIVGGIRLFDLSSDGATLYFNRDEVSTQGVWRDLKAKHDHLEFGHGNERTTRIWSLDLASWKADEFYASDRYIRDFDVSPDGIHLAMITTPDRRLISHEGWSRLDVVHIPSGTQRIATPDGWRDKHPSKFGWVEGVAFSSDSKAIAFSVSFDGYPTELYVVYLGEKSAGLHRVPLSDTFHVADGTNLKWQGATRGLCFLGSQRARKRVFKVMASPGDRRWETEALTAGDIVISDFSFDGQGTQMIVALADTTRAADIFRVDAPSNYHQLTHINPQIDTWKLPRIKEVTWTGADGDEVHGILELPHDYDESTPLPLIVELHGGPTAATHLQLRFWIYGRTLMAAKGYALLSPNYRGSLGYGRKFMTDLIGHENQVEVQDILSGVDAMIEGGIADPDRIGVMGWSNGGYLTNCLITQSDRFKAASSGAGILSMLLQWSAEDTPGHVVNFMQGLPWERIEPYTHASPVYQLHKIKTPTLIHVGGDDARCPPVHSKGLYRALRHYLDVPTELIVYPGEGHGLTTYDNRKAKMEWDLAWFEHYLKPVED